MQFARAVADLAAGPEPDAAAAFRQLQLAQRRWLELGREHARQAGGVAHGLRGAIEWHEAALADAREHVDELNARLDEADRVGRDLVRQLEEMKDSRAYRMAVAARRLKPGGKR